MWLKYGRFPGWRAYKPRAYKEQCILVSHVLRQVDVYLRFGNVMSVEDLATFLSNLVGMMKTTLL